MRVLVIPTWYPSGADKLMGIYHKEFTEALNKYGIDANMLYIDRERLSKPIKFLFMKKKHIDKESNYNAYIYSMLNLAPISFKWQLNRYIKKLDRSFKDYLKTNEKPDVLHAMVTVPAGYAACILGKKYNIPVVVTEHGGALERFFKRDDLKEYGKFVLENSTYSTVSNYMKDIVLKYHNECYVIPNQVNTSIFDKEVKRKIKGTFKLVSLCALREGKRLDIAFKALHKLVDEGMDIHLDVIGDGFYENIFKEACKKEGMDDYVTFLGRKTKDKVSSIFEDEHALLISSELESFAIPGVEALAAGMPVITTACLGPEEYVNEKTGVICKVNDTDDMARAIKELYKKYNKYNVSDLKAQANKYSEKSVVEVAKKVYEIALKKNK